MHGRTFSNAFFEAQAPDPLSKGDLPVAPESDEVKHFLADVDADNCQVRPIGFCLPLHCCFSCRPLLALEG